MPATQEKTSILKQGGTYSVQREFNRLFGRTSDKDRVLVYLAHKVEVLEARLAELEKKPKIGRPKKEKVNGTLD
tara:strand:+ start:334 stop:555 length:222 start_codon:yes stop_codon:yes gene_type:complete